MFLLFSLLLQQALLARAVDLRADRKELEEAQRQRLQESTVSTWKSH